MHEVKMTVHPDGTVQTDFAGFVGPTCLAEAEKLRAALAALGITLEQTNFIAKPELAVPISLSDQEQQTIHQEGQ